VTIASTFVALAAAAAAFWSGYEAHKTRVDDQRAFLSIDILPWGPDDKVIQPIADVRVLSTGKSAANNVSINCSTSLDLNMPWRENDPHVHLNFSYILPNRFIPINCGTIHSPTPEIKQPVITLGLITYYDESRNYHQTPFCFNIIPSRFTKTTSQPCNNDDGLPELK